VSIIVIIFTFNNTPTIEGLRSNHTTFLSKAVYDIVKVLKNYDINKVQSELINLLFRLKPNSNFKVQFYCKLRNHVDRYLV
jgi:hypothetical protein